MSGALRVLEGPLRVVSGDVTLMGYVVEPRMPESDSPKPYLHPLRTLAGNVVTAVRPHDHTWHNGLQFTMANLSARGEKWLSERRTIVVGPVDPARGCWTLSWTSRLRNTSGHELRWGSPVTEGRPTAGYGGLFWRGPRSFTGGSVRTPDGVTGDDVMGHRAPWLAFTGRHDESLGTSTLLFVDSPSNPGHPTAWYARSAPFPVVSFAATYHRERRLGPDEELAMTHHLVLIDGEWDVERLDEQAAMSAAGQE